MVSLKAGVGFKCIRCIKMPLANATHDDHSSIWLIVPECIDWFVIVHFGFSFLVACFVEVIYHVPSWLARTILSLGE
jgi:hypothetical protein